MSDELKPCPFCGGEAHLCHDWSSEAGATYWNVWHECDGPQGRSAGYGHALMPWYETPWYTNRETAVDSWNRRAVKYRKPTTMGELERENAKLRELVQTLVHCLNDVDCDKCPLNGNPYEVHGEWAACDALRDRMRELGVEVDA